MEGRRRGADTDGDDGAGKLGIQSVEIGMQLLATLVEHGFDSPPPMLKTLAARAGMPAAKAHRYIVSLVRSKLVERDALTGRYRLGPMARLIGLRAVQSLDVVRLGAGRLQTIAADLGFSVTLSVWAPEGPTVVANENVRRPITIGTRLGEVMPILTSATGQVFGAWLPETATEAHIARERAASAKAGRDVDSLLERVRRTGLGVSAGGLNPTINALSAPIFDRLGRLAAALSSLGPVAEFDVRVEGPVAAGLKQHAAALSLALRSASEALSGKGTDRAS